MRFNKLWFPNFPLVLRLKPTPKQASRIEMPADGTEGIFKTNEIILDTVPTLTKPEIKNFLMAVYGLNVKKINSLVRMGTRRNERSEMPRQLKDFKRFYVTLHEEVYLPNVPKSLSTIRENAEKGLKNATE